MGVIPTLDDSIALGSCPIEWMSVTYTQDGKEHEIRVWPCPPCLWCKFKTAVWRWLHR